MSPAEADRRRQIEVAQHIAAAAGPLTGTTGEYYFKQVRGIPCPAGGWPASIRWHAKYFAVLAVATLPDGAVQAVQRNHLDQAGEQIGAAEITRRDLHCGKVTNGSMKGAAVRFPGSPAGPLLFAEGVETALAVHAATGFEVWCALGSVAKLEPPTDRQVLLISNDNPPEADAKDGDTAEALRKWRQSGADVAVLHPWETRRFDRSDFAELILERGHDAVRARIMHGLTAAAAAAQRLAAVPVGPHYTHGSLRTADAASRRLQRVVKATFSRLERHLGVQDEIAAEATRILPDTQAQSEKRILANLIRKRDAAMAAEEFDPNGIDWDTVDIHELARERAARVANRVARNAARRAAVPRFGRRAARAIQPRIQIKGVAGLGKLRLSSRSSSGGLVYGDEILSNMCPPWH